MLATQKANKADSWPSAVTGEPSLNSASATRGKLTDHTRVEDLPGGAGTRASLPTRPQS